MALFPDNRHDRSGYRTTTRICPPHLRGKEVGRSYHDVESRQVRDYDQTEGVGALLRREFFKTVETVGREPNDILRDLRFIPAEGRSYRYGGAVTGRIDHTKANPSAAPKSSAPRRDAKMIATALMAKRTLQEALDLGELVAAFADHFETPTTDGDIQDWLALPDEAVQAHLVLARKSRAQREERQTVNMQGSPSGGQPGYITREQFDRVVEAVWSEIQYQNHLPRRTADEAKDCAGFATLGRAYLRKLEDNWYSKPGEVQPEGNVAVTDCLHDLRKLSAIFVRAMIYCGIRSRS